MKERVEVSHEMIAFVGRGGVDEAGWPNSPIMLLFTDLGSRSVVEVVSRPTAACGEAAELVFVVCIAACERLFSSVRIDDGRWHMSSELSRLALAITNGPSDPAGTALRLARSIELLCGGFEGLGGGTLVQADGRTLTRTDALRMATARRLIDERWREKLTLDDVARACGVNRAKLTRGFREQFHCSVGDLIADHRLNGAREMLLATDLSVASVGHACGYLSNASFTRAFTRRFGVPPTRARQRGAAA